MIFRKSLDVDALLDVVRQVEVRVVELVGRARSLRAERTRERRPPAAPGRRRTRASAIERRDGLVDHALIPQKFISRLMWKMLPLAPTGIGYAV